MDPAILKVGEEKSARSAKFGIGLPTREVQEHTDAELLLDFGYACTQLSGKAILVCRHVIVHVQSILLCGCPKCMYVCMHVCR